LGGAGGVCGFIFSKSSKDPDMGGLDAPVLPATGGGEETEGFGADGTDAVTGGGVDKG